jgi:hypothetical protein
MTESLFSDNRLLDLAEAVLTEAGFATRRAFVASADAPWLLAEDQLFVIAVIATKTLADARRLESYAATELLQRIATPVVGAKKWDAYLVLLAEQIVDDPLETRQLVELQYNTRGVRRLVASGVSDRASIAPVLRPFLPLPRPVPGGLSDSLTGLAEQLVLNGIERDKAERYVAAFAQTGNLDDV